MTSITLTFCVFCLPFFSVMVFFKVLYFMACEPLTSACRSVDLPEPVLPIVSTTFRMMSSSCCWNAWRSTFTIILSLKGYYFTYSALPRSSSFESILSWLNICRILFKIDNNLTETACPGHSPELPNRPPDRMWILKHGPGQARWRILYIRPGHAVVQSTVADCSKKFLSDTVVEIVYWIKSRRRAKRGGGLY